MEWKVNGEQLAEAIEAMEKETGKRMGELRRTTFVFLPAEEQIEMETGLTVTNLSRSEILRPVMERIVELAERARTDTPPRQLEDKEVHKQCRAMALGE